MNVFLLRILCGSMLVLELAVPATPKGNSAAKKEFRVEGRVLRHDHKPFIRSFPRIFLHGAFTPLDRQTVAGPDGRFVFKKIPPGSYTLSSAVRRAGELSKTVVVGPGLADPKGKITADLVYDASPLVRNEPTVSAVELSVPEGAKKEFFKAKQLLGHQDVKGAMERLNKAVSLAPQFAAAWNAMGTISFLKKQYPQAENYFREALKQEPDSYPPLVNLGGTLFSMNRLEEALQYNLTAVKARPTDPLAQSQLGSNYFFLGKMEMAETHLKTAKRLDPNHFSYPQLLLAEIFVRKNQLPAALAEMEDFLRRNPDSDWAPRVRKLVVTIGSRQPKVP
jgi:tetratricopeptide (TPR) repeat protein